MWSPVLTIHFHSISSSTTRDVQSNTTIRRDVWNSSLLGRLIGLLVEEGRNVLKLRLSSGRPLCNSITIGELGCESRSRAIRGHDRENHETSLSKLRSLLVFQSLLLERTIEDDWIAKGILATFRKQDAACEFSHHGLFQAAHINRTQERAIQDCA